jgi:hypothetical protein
MPDQFTIPPAWAFSGIDIINLGPKIDPPFSDARDYSQYLTRVETRPAYSEQLEPSLTDEGARQATDVALASDQVSRELQGKRHAVLGVGSKSMDRQTDHPLVVIYNYTDDVVVEATIDLAAATVLQVSPGVSQPALAANEQSEALDLVRQDGRLTDADIDVDTGAGIIVEEVNPNSSRYRHRLVDLRFGPADRRLPTAFAIVDLTAQDVVSTGLVPEGSS